MKKNLNKYSLKNILRNPMDIHIIQDELGALKGNDMLSMAIKKGAYEDIDSCLKMIVGGYIDNAEMLTGIVGIDLLRKIESYLGNPFLKPANTTEELPDNIPAGLFQRPGIFGYAGDN